MKSISNGRLSISVKEHGAELCSLKCNEREYLWQADAAFWKRHSPVLFPIVGALWNGEFRSHDKIYKMGQHGFARDMDFSLVKETENELHFELLSSDETLEKYPYPFKLRIGYRLDDNKVSVLWHVENPGTEKMFFQIGAHPAFHWPLLTNEQIDGGVETMTKPLADTDSRGYFKFESDTKTLSLSTITEAGCVGAVREMQIEEDGMLPLSLFTFGKDALVIEDYHIRKVTICREDKSPYLSVEFTSPLVGLWSPPGKRAPFVCIEPWYGRTDPVGFDGNYEDKPWIQSLEPGASFDASYDIIIH